MEENTWQTCYEADNSIFFEDITSINKMVIIAVGFKSGTGRSIICKSVDGGKNWEMQTGPFYSYLNDVFFVTESIVFCAGSQGTILKSTDGGNNWQKMNSGTGLTLQSIFFSMSGNMEITFTNENTGYIVGGSMNQSLIQKTIDGGETWLDISPNISKGFLGVSFPSLNVGYVVGSAGTVVKQKPEEQ
ncbi:MAG: hypothetical protein IPL63_05880 [Saprospiraceae bacterium]|nr:hypothetical protein [Saprospiraceae bacterium]